MDRRLRGTIAARVSVVVLVIATGAYAQLNEDERKCSDTANRRGRNVGNQEQKANRGCVKTGSGSIESCVAVTSPNATSQGAELAAQFPGTGGKCDPLPGFGVSTPAAAITAGVVAAADEIIRDVFGNPADGIAAGDKCADAVARRSGLKFDTAMKAFRGCAKNLGSIMSIAALEACAATALADANTIGAQGKLLADMNNSAKCPAFPVAGADDGQCSDAITAAAFAACVGNVVNCQACLAMNAIIGGSTAICDAVDNGLNDQSCGGYPAIAIGTHMCTLGGASQLVIKGVLPLAPLSASGAIDIACGTTGPEGQATCTCGVQAPGFAAMNIAGILFGCVKPAISGVCSSGEIDCNGGNALGVDIQANRNIGSCSSQASCLTSCSAFCGGAVVDSGCEGFCTGGANSACTTDSNCAGLGQGSCDGPESVGLGNVCDCTCIQNAVGAASPSGTLQCQLPFNLTLEAIPGNGIPCDGLDVIVDLGDTCAPLSTQSAKSVLNNANNGGTSIPPGGATLVGEPADCSLLAGSDTSAITLQGAAIFYASAIGDLNSLLTLDCQ